MTAMDTLSVLAQCPVERIKPFVDALLPSLGTVTLLRNRAGIALLPYRDSAKGTPFLLGEVLMSEAHVRIASNSAEGYGACLGRDIVQALAVAVLDAALRGGHEVDHILAFVAAERAALVQADEHLIQQVDATRVQMETF